jgi:DAK2 domain fusion protein YloV
VPDLDRLGADALRQTVVTFRDTLKRHQADLNKLNVYPVPDGDTGTNMARTLDAVVAELEKPAVDGSLAAICAAISHGALMGARGNSGVILSQVLRGISATMRDATDHGPATVATALRAAAAAAYEAVLKPVEGTILTVVRECAEAASAAAQRNGSLAEVLRAARDEGRASLARTPEILPVLKDAGVVDAGGAGWLLFLDAALHVAAGEALPEPQELAGPTTEQLIAVSRRTAAEGEVDVSELRYEVMFLLEIEDTTSHAFKQAWGKVGDSIVVVGGEGIYNCHIHTNDIGAAIEAPIGLGGRPHQIRVTDLFEEVAEEHAKREAEIGVPASPVPVRTVPRTALPPVTCAVVAVASGDGLAELFGAMGVHGVVTGGQTMNPSTQELLDAVEHMNASQVVILPNNKNIIAVAQQVDGLTAKDVRVVPTCSMPEGLAALVAYDPEASAEHNGSQMATAASAVATGEVTTAVRDTQSEAGPVRAGDVIGIVRGDGVVAASTDLVATCTTLLERLVTPEREIVTVVTGEGSSAAATEQISAWLATHRPGVTIEVHEGGQPLYPYLFGVE